MNTVQVSVRPGGLLMLGIKDYDTLIDEWKVLITENMYRRYFEACSVLSCKYRTKDDKQELVAGLFGLIGGISTAMALLSSWVYQLLKWWFTCEKVVPRVDIGVRWPQSLWAVGNASSASGGSSNMENHQRSLRLLHRPRGYTSQMENY